MRPAQLRAGPGRGICGILLMLKEEPMTLNKKLLAVAIVGTLTAGTAAAADLSGSPVVPAYFAEEIVIGPNGTVLTTSASPATSLTWRTGYNFSALEVRYARLECSDTIELDAGSVAITNPGNANIGSINGAGTNVLTFSLTSTGTNITQNDVLTLTGNHTILSTDTSVTCEVGLYDQPSQAQTGGTAGLIAGSHFSGAYLSFVPSFYIEEFVPTTHVADVEAMPAYSGFVPDGVITNATSASLGRGTAFRWHLRDPDGSGVGQTAPFGVDGQPLTISVVGSGTGLEIDGDFSIAASTGSTPFDAAARGRVRVNGIHNAATLTSSKAFFSVYNCISGCYIELTRRTPALVIPEAEYTVTYKLVSAQPTVYAFTDITGVKLGSIVRNGTQLQAPLAQVPGGWLSRLALTNTGSTARPYTIAVQGETGNTISTSNLTGTVPANGTTVIDLTTVLTGFTASPRATLNVTVAGPNNQIQGLYQIVNPDKGSISNHVLVRPGKN